MGTRRKKPLADEHISTNLYIKTIFRCNNCPFKLYAKDNDKVKLGIGNIYSNTMIILPNYNTEAKIGYITILKLLQNIYKKVFNKDLLENYYITRFVKCYDNTPFNLLNTAFENNCYAYLTYEISRLKPKKIIIFDKGYWDEYVRYFYGDIIKVFTVMNPAVLYYDNEELKQKFIQQLKEVL